MDPWNQDGGMDDDDFVDGIDDEDDELGIDYTARAGGVHPLEDAANAAHAPRSAVQRPAPYRGPALQPFKQPKARIRRMSPQMAARSPGVSSILITKLDGSQVLLVKG